MKRRSISLLLLSALFVSALSGWSAIPVRAAGIIRVTTDANANWPCGDGWQTSCPIQIALEHAISGDEIWVAAGIYKPTTVTSERGASFHLKTNVAIYGGFDGNLDNTLEDRNPSDHLTILSGDLLGNDNDQILYSESTRMDNSYNVVTGATEAVLDGFTITGGNAFDGGLPQNCPIACGAGMYNFDSSPTLANITFTRNSAIYGAGMYNENSEPVLTNVIFISNASHGPGGGMLNISSIPTLTDVTFVDNRTASSGGGMANEQSSPILKNVIFDSNAATYGGGMDNYTNSSPIIMNVTFSGNISKQGGGINNTYNSNPTLTNVTFSGNPAFQGGGMSNTLSSPTLTNVTFSGNGNIGSEGSEMFNGNSSNPQIQNTIFWDNTGVPPIAGDSSSFPDVNYSVVQGGYESGTNIIIADPFLGTLGNYGGYTQTIPILTGSSAIDTGNDLICPTIDQRVIPRPLGLHCDIGAFEWGTYYQIRFPLISR